VKKVAIQSQITVLNGREKLTSFMTNRQSQPVKIYYLIDESISSKKWLKS